MVAPVPAPEEALPGRSEPMRVPATGAEPAGQATEYFFSEQLSAFFEREQHAMWLRWNPTPRPNFNPDLLRDLGLRRDRIGFGAHTRECSHC